MIKSSDIPPLATTGIGSLPHRQCAPALDSAFAVDIPYFPTLPGLEAKEGILAQALTGFPGVFVKSGGELSFEWSAWERGREALTERLGRALLRGPGKDALPIPEGGMWDLFLKRAAGDSRIWFKAQMLGPITAVLALGGLEDAPVHQAMELVAQLSEWLFAKALAMYAELARLGKRVLFFWDEPGLGSPGAARAPGRWAAEHLRERIEELKNMGATVGLHCCGKWNFQETLDWPLDVLSFDAALMGEMLLSEPERLASFRERGGRLALGLVPTEIASTWNFRREVEQWRTRCVTALGEEAARGVLAESLLTPACGLGLRSVEEAEQVFRLLQEIQSEMSRSP